MNEIKLKQKPIITHELVKVGESVTKRLADLNIEGQVATVDTVKTIKKLRATLNKEHEQFNDDIKTVLSPVSSVIDEVKESFKINISEKYKSADDILKSKVAIVEDKVKANIRNAIELYFNELCQSEEIDFLKFENVGLTINLSTTEKKYKEQCNAFVMKVKDEIALIETNKYKLEIMVEYRSTLNVAASIKTVQDRKKKEEEERLRLEKQKHLARSKKLISIGLEANAETKSYMYSNEIYVSWDSVKDIEEKEFTEKIIELDELVKADKKEKLEAAKLKEKPFGKVIVQEEPIITKTEQVTESKKPITQTEVLKAPVEEKKLELAKVRWEIYGTMAELMGSKQYLIDNNLTYKNI